MEFTLTTPALLFPAISLLLLAYTNRFLALAALVRELHRQYQERPDPIIAKQIKNLRMRIELIRNMQLLGVLSFFLCTLCMFIMFLGSVILGEVAFGAALVALMASLVLSVIEVRNSTYALFLRLQDMEERGAKEVAK
jgi:hypothetical protein